MTLVLSLATTQAQVQKTLALLQVRLPLLMLLMVTLLSPFIRVHPLATVLHPLISELVRGHTHRIHTSTAPIPLR